MKRANEKSYATFQEGSSAIVYVSAFHNYTTLTPCYTVGSDGLVNITSGIGECFAAWITSGRSVRDNCLKELGDQATPLQAYIAGLYGMSTVSELYEYEYGCTTLLDWPESDMESVYMEQTRSLSTYLSPDRAYGSFFPTSSLKNWVEDAHYFSTQLQMANTLDEQTRTFIVYLITRNLNEDDLFYSRVKLTFIFTVEGSSSVELETTYSPIIDFSYGTNDHDWVMI